MCSLPRMLAVAAALAMAGPVMAQGPSVLEQLEPVRVKYGVPALAAAVVKDDWTPQPVLTHNGSNSLNLAVILVDTDNDLGIVVTTNFPGQKADAAALEALQGLYEQHGPGSAEGTR